ncbi:hypothetical protein CLF_104863 [Clonorchis sinensis]|uniref:Endonuclease/exonuclease/phosphatase domain-containing protein n=1 Tax=Clonorchis sinensis TaxID=79923 RepID=G7YP16_CLOSI|nr:hypothetical protein CLF_104863 [Clonorchis sinensis]
MAEENPELEDQKDKESREDWMLARVETATGPECVEPMKEEGSLSYGVRGSVKQHFDTCVLTVYLVLGLVFHRQSSFFLETGGVSSVHLTLIDPRLDDDLNVFFMGPQLSPVASDACYKRSWIIHLQNNTCNTAHALLGKDADGLCETWLTPEVPDAEISIDGYSVFRADPKRRRAGEVALCLHAPLPIPIFLSDTAPASFCDALWIQVPLCGSILGVVYRCPSSPPEDDHILIRTLGQLSSSYHFTHLLLVGDFNAPKAPWTELQCVGSSGPFAAALTEVVQQSAWTQHVVAPTRYRAGQQPSLLDLVITNERHFVDQVTINAPLGHSDHCVLTFDFICYWARNPEPQTWIRNFCRANTSGMHIFLGQVKLGPASVEDLYRAIVQKVHEADAISVPIKPACSWMSRKLPKRIRRLLEKRSQLFFKKLTTGDTEDELAIRKMRNRCKSEIRQWNIRKQTTILDLARKNRNVLFKYMRHRRRNKPSSSQFQEADLTGLLKGKMYNQLRLVHTPYTSFKQSCSGQLTSPY